MVNQGKDMSPTKHGFRFLFCLPLTGLVFIFLTACQPLIQAQTGTQTKIFVNTAHQDKATTPAKQNKTIAPVSTALTAEDISAAPLLKDRNSKEPPDNKANIKGPEQLAVKTTRSSQPVKPATKPAFDPAELVGRTHSYVSAQFGEADFKRTEGIIHVLQYRQPDCVIDLFIKIDGITDPTPGADGEILDWAMRERTISQPLNQILCQQQFYERKL